jgi:hypothetical protein
LLGELSRVGACLCAGGAIDDEVLALCQGAGAQRERESDCGEGSRFPAAAHAPFTLQRNRRARLTGNGPSSGSASFPHGDRVPSFFSVIAPPARPHYRNECYRSVIVPFSPIRPGRSESSRGNGTS